MAQPARNTADDARFREAHIRALSPLMMRTVLELAVFALLCLLGTAIVVLALRR